MIIGQYVQTFAEASHALPDGMHMNADYPFMLPRIVRLEGRIVTIAEGGKETSFELRRGPRGEEGFIEQSSSFEVLFKRKPQRFRMMPFKDERSPAVGAEGRML